MAQRQIALTGRREKPRKICFTRYAKRMRARPLPSRNAWKACPGRLGGAVPGSGRQEGQDAARPCINQVSGAPKSRISRYSRQGRLRTRNRTSICGRLSIIFLSLFWIQLK
ncbi:hypothetical protein HMPREF3038_00591 [Akkermansia sp. KLE1797]|nr:hypothetical protein HMPREF3038_00591 [Akkermansia sp. KLE1797]KZA04679.1 hypothetical protein HMPREF1326_01734 [Akkermansia sp. KLE1605]